MKSNLSYLIEFPEETLENEYKGWVDFGQRIVQAKIARHLAALTNHGGGYLIFGFKDDLTLDRDRPTSLKNYNRDTFTNIVGHYLEPAFQCSVQFVPNQNGEEFPVVRVPSHGRVPVITRAGGPQDKKGKSLGISNRTYYIRKPGPQSAPIEGFEEWSGLIRRCTLNDRDSLLKDFANLINSTEKVEFDVERRLDLWHQEAEKRFWGLLSGNRGNFPWPVPFNDNRYHLSYAIFSDGEELPPESFHQVLKEVTNKVRDTIWNGWSMFYLSLPPEIAPTTCPERADGTGCDVLEANLTGDQFLDYHIPEFWRIAPDGRASLIRAYMEDRQRSIRSPGRPAGTWLSVERVIRETSEIVTHAMLLAERFETATQVSFRCTWTGLENRRLAEFNPSGGWLHGHPAKPNSRTIEKTYTVAELKAKWSNVVSDLSCPVLRLFGFKYCSPEFVENQKASFLDPSIPRY